MEVLHEVEENLRSLSVEARKVKYMSGVKEAAEGAIIKLRSLKEGYAGHLRKCRLAEDNQAQEAAAKPPPFSFKSTELAQPFLLACNYGNESMSGSGPVGAGVGSTGGVSVKITLLALASLQHLMYRDALHPDDAPNVMRILSIQVSSSNTQIQLRVLQSCLLLVSSSGAADHMSEDLLSKALLVCFSLSEAKDSTVKNASKATIRQIISMVFDKVRVSMGKREQGEEGENGRAGGGDGDGDRDGGQDSPSTLQDASDAEVVGMAKCAYLVFQDLCVLIRGEQGQWLKRASVPAVMGLELIEQILSQQTTLFTQHHVFRSLVSRQVCPVVLQVLRDPASSFPIVIRGLRTAATLFREFGMQIVDECEPMLSMILRCIASAALRFTPQTSGAAGAGPGHPPALTQSSSNDGEQSTEGFWYALLSLECLQHVCSNQELLFALFLKYDLSKPPHRREPVVGNLIQVAAHYLTQGTITEQRIAIVEAAMRRAGDAEPPPSPGGGGQNHSPPSPTSGKSASTPHSATIEGGGLGGPLLHSHYGGYSARDLLHDSHAPRTASPEGATLSLALECLVGVASVLQARTVGEYGVEGGVVGMPPLSMTMDDTSAERAEDKANVRAFVTATWEHFLMATSQLLIHCTAQRQQHHGGTKLPDHTLLVQRILHIHVSVSIAAGLSGMTSQRDGLLGSLCKAALPTWHGPELTQTAFSNTVTLLHHHVDIIHALLLVSHTLANSLGATWAVVLDTFDQLDQVAHRKWAGKHPDVGGGGGGGMGTSSILETRGRAGSIDLQEHKLQDVLARFVEFTAHLEDETLVHIMDALIALNRSSLSISPTATSGHSSLAGSGAGAHLHHGQHHSQGLPPALTPQGPSGDSSSAPTQGLPGASASMSSMSVSGISDSQAKGLTKVFGSFMSSVTGRVASFYAPVGSQGGGGYAAPDGLLSVANDSVSSSDVVPSASPSKTTAQRAPAASFPPATPSGSAASASTAVNSLAPSSVKFATLPFALRTIVGLAKQNSHRLGLIWPKLIQHLEVVSNHRSPTMRSYAVEALRTIIEQILDRVHGSGGGALDLGDDDDTGGDNGGAQLLVSGKFVGLLSAADYRTITFDHIFSVAAGSAHASTKRALNFSGGVEGTESDNGSSSDDVVPFDQDHLFSPLRVLARRVAPEFTDVRELALVATHSMVASNGQRLEQLWEDVLCLLIEATGQDVRSDGSSGTGTRGTDSAATIAVAGETPPGDEAQPPVPAGTAATSARRAWGGQCVAIAFRSLKLVVDDFFDAVPLRHLSLCVECMGAFGKQAADMNISLTAVGMLWSVVDFISHQEASQQDSDAHSAVWAALFSELAALAVDDRPEVRNCAVNTLVSCVVANGTVLDAHQWRVCLEEVLLPIINDVQKLTEAAPKHGLNTASGMKVHYTRDSEHKLWSETRVLTLQGLVRLLGTASRHWDAISAHGVPTHGAGPKSNTRGGKQGKAAGKGKRQARESGVGDGPMEWLVNVWTSALQLATDAVLMGSKDQQVALAGVHMICALVRMSSTNLAEDKQARYGTTMRVVDGALVDTSAEAGGGDAPSAPATNATATADRVSRLCAYPTLWESAWSALLRACMFEVDLEGDVSGAVAEGLASIYEVAKDCEFKPENRLIEFLELLGSLLSARIPADAQGKTFVPPVFKFQREALETIRGTKPRTAKAWARIFAILAANATPDGPRRSERFSAMVLDALKEVFVVEGGGDRVRTRAQAAAFTDVISGVASAPHKDTDFDVLAAWEMLHPEALHTRAEALEWWKKACARPAGRARIAGLVPLNSLDPSVDLLVTLSGPGLRAISATSGKAPADPSSRDSAVTAATPTLAASTGKQQSSSASQPSKDSASARSGSGIASAGDFAGFDSALPTTQRRRSSSIDLAQALHVHIPYQEAARTKEARPTTPKSVVQGWNTLTRHALDLLLPWKIVDPTAPIEQHLSVSTPEDVSQSVNPRLRLIEFFTEQKRIANAPRDNASDDEGDALDQGATATRLPVSAQRSLSQTYTKVLIGLCSSMLVMCDQTAAFVDQRPGEMELVRVIADQLVLDAQTSPDWSSVRIATHGLECWARHMLLLLSLCIQARASGNAEATALFTETQQQALQTMVVTVLEVVQRMQATRCQTADALVMSLHAYLVDCIRSPSPEIRGKAADVLAGLDLPRAISMITKSADDTQRELDAANANIQDLTAQVEGRVAEAYATGFSF